MKESNNHPLSTHHVREAGTVSLRIRRLYRHFACELRAAKTPFVHGCWFLSSQYHRQAQPWDRGVAVVYEAAEDPEVDQYSSGLNARRSAEVRML